MIVEVLHTVDMANVLDGVCSEEVYDHIRNIDPFVFEIDVSIDRNDEILDVVPGPDGCATALYLGLLQTIAPHLKAGQYQEIVQALRDHEHKWHNDELPTLAMEVLRGRMESLNEREAI